MASGPVLMIAKRGPTPKRKDRNCKEQGPRRCFWPRSPQMFFAPVPAVPETAADDRDTVRRGAGTGLTTTFPFHRRDKGG